MRTLIIWLAVIAIVAVAANTRKITCEGNQACNGKSKMIGAEYTNGVLECIGEQACNSVVFDCKSEFCLLVCRGGKQSCNSVTYRSHDSTRSYLWCLGKEQNCNSVVRKGTKLKKKWTKCAEEKECTKDNGCFRWKQEILPGKVNKNACNSVTKT